MRVSIDKAGTYHEPFGIYYRNVFIFWRRFVIPKRRYFPLVNAYVSFFEDPVALQNKTVSDDELHINAAESVLF